MLNSINQNLDDENYTNLNENNEIIIVATTSTNFPQDPQSNFIKRTNKKVNVSPIDTEESSEDSYTDIIEEGRTLLKNNKNNSYYAAARTINSENEDDGTVQSTVKKIHHRKLPDEKWKAGIGVICLFFAAVSNDIVLSFIHDKLPKPNPLPDFLFSHTPYLPWTLSISEYLMLTLFLTLIILTLFHRYRWIILRRIAVIGCLLYFGRCVTMFITQVPIADSNYKCSPKFLPEQQTFWNIFLRGLRALTGLGLNINGKLILCGDYIYSGHTVMHVTCYLFIKEYSPKKWYILHWTAMLFATIGVFCLILSRGHYSIDILIAYWIATRTFWEYHTLANIPLLRNNQQGRNHLVKFFWFPLLNFMESNVMRPVPRKYGLPFYLPWQKNKT